jgi:hypothetical protein
MDMKPFENCKIAVCLSGQSRTFKYCAESINKFFSSEKNNQYYFFGHTTDKNYFKIKSDSGVSHQEFETLEIEKLKTELNSHFNFSKLLVEPEKQRNFNFGVQLYSQMMANYLKQKYEIENNMMFDLVIRARYDIVYPHNSLFEHYINFLIEEKTLYTHFGLMRHEFVLPNPNQIFHYGSSFTMDLVDSFYNILVDNKFKQLVNFDAANPAWNRVGDGALLYKWCTMKNINFREGMVRYSIIRKQSLGLDYKTEWDKVHKVGWFMDVEK